MYLACEEPSCLTTLHRLLRRLLADAPEDLRIDAELVAVELVTNSFEHASGPRSATIAWTDDGLLHIAVVDAARRRTHPGPLTARRPPRTRPHRRRRRRPLGSRPWPDQQDGVGEPDVLTTRTARAGRGVSTSPASHRRISGGRSPHGRRGRARSAPCGPRRRRVSWSVTVSVPSRTRSTATASVVTTGRSACRMTSCSSSEIAGPSSASPRLASVIGSRSTRTSSCVTGTVTCSCSVTTYLRSRARPDLLGLGARAQALLGAGHRVVGGRAGGVVALGPRRRPRSLPGSSTGRRRRPRRGVRRAARGRARPTRPVQPPP